MYKIEHEQKGGTKTLADFQDIVLIDDVYRVIKVQACISKICLGQGVLVFEKKHSCEIVEIQDKDLTGYLQTYTTGCIPVR